MKALTLLAALMLTACATSAGFGQSGGVATYDDLRSAQKACEARGGSLKLQKNGDPHFLDDYACEKN